ncbi:BRASSINOSTEROID INSENSITIVE 1-associated receptor kinase 1, partial [Striga hermonthica]
EALITFKEQLSDPTNSLQTWDQTLASPCSFSHVTCADDVSVTSIDLGLLNLTGQLVADLGKLTNLQSFSAFENNIYGPIPPEFGEMTELVTLNLFSNNLSGGIPPELGNLKNLKLIRVINNPGLSGLVSEALACHPDKIEL